MREEGCLVVVPKEEVTEIGDVLRQPFDEAVQQRVAIARAKCGSLLSCGLYAICIGVNQGEAVAVRANCQRDYCDGLAAGTAFVSTL